MSANKVSNNKQNALKTVKNLLPDGMSVETRTPLKELLEMCAYLSAEQREVLEETRYDLDTMNSRFGRWRQMPICDLGLIVQLINYIAINRFNCDITQFLMIT